MTYHDELARQHDRAASRTTQAVGIEPVSRRSPDESPRGHNRTRRWMLYASLGTLATCSGAVWVFNQVAEMHNTSVSGGDYTPTGARATASTPASNPEAPKKSPESARTYNATPMKIIDTVTLPNGTGSVIASPGSTKDNIAQLASGSVMVIALGAGSEQYGQFSGDVSALETRASDSTSPPFINYEGQADARGVAYTGQMLVVTIDIPNQPVYCITPPGNGGAPVYHAMVFTQEAYAAAGPTLLDEIASDPQMPLGSNPLKTQMQSSSAIG